VREQSAEELAFVGKATQDRDRQLKSQTGAKRENPDETIRSMLREPQISPQNKIEQRRTLNSTRSPIRAPQIPTAERQTLAQESATIRVKK
jgi:hypothetical protein